MRRRKGERKSRRSFNNKIQNLGQYSQFCEFLTETRATLMVIKDVSVETLVTVNLTRDFRHNWQYDWLID